jgi:hypothetical protein
MFLVEWFLIGSFFGWILSSAYRQVRGPTPHRLPSKTKAAVTFGIGVVLLIITLRIAWSNDHAALSSFILNWKAFFVGGRVRACLFGAFFGVLVEHQRGILGHAARQIGGAIIGEGGNKSWIFQGAVVLALLAAIIFAVRPEFFDYLRSVKLGEFEATFSDHEPTALLREAHLNLRDFREQIALNQYKDFYQTFLSEEKPRGWARKLVMDDKLRTETAKITETLATYVDPVINSLLCLHDVNALRAAPRDYDLVLYAALWENFLLKLHADKLEVDKAIVPFLMGLRSHLQKVVDHTNDLAPGCIGRLTIKGTDEDNGKTIADHYANAAKILSAKGYREGKVLAVVAFEPYFAGAVSDLIALLSGDREKTDFLLKMMNGVPQSEEFVSPGIVNFYYQIADAWLNTTGPIPLEDTRTEIEFATTSVDHILSRSKEKISSLQRWGERLNLSYCTAPDGSTEPAQVKDASVENTDGTLDHPENVVQIYDIFLRNLLATLTAEADIYVQRALEGQPLPEDYRQSWINVVSRLSAMMQVRQNAPMIDFDGVRSSEIDYFMKERLRVQTIEICGSKSADPSKEHVQYLIDPDFMLQADLALALSSVLLNGGTAPSSQSCNTGLYYANDAETWIDRTVKDNGLDKAQEQRLKQLVSAVATRVGTPCASTNEKN